MSWELTVNGGKTISPEKWIARVRRLGAVIEPHPDFAIHTQHDWLPVSLTITRRELFAAAAPFVDAGPLMAGFELEVEAFGPFDREVDPTATLRAFDERLAELIDNSAPEIVVDQVRERRASFERAVHDQADEQRVYFRVPEGLPNAHHLSYALGAAGYALASGGTLTDLAFGSSHPKASGDTILAWLAEQLAVHHGDPRTHVIGQRFTSWA